MKSESLTAESFRDTIQAFQKSRILLTAFELKIFSYLDFSCMDAAHLAKRINTDERATERLLNAVTALGLLEKMNNVYSNTPFASQYLVESSPDYMMGLGHSANMWHSWTTLTEVVRTGKSVVEPAISKRGKEWLRSFIAAMHMRAKVYSDESVRDLDLTHVSRVLDVGGGSGDFAMAFIRKKKSITATVFDLHEVTLLTKEYIAKAGMEHQIDTYSGNYTVDKLPHGYDLVFLSAIVHSNSFEVNSELIKNCADALNPGGQIIIQDYIMNNERTAPAGGTIFAINMLVGTESGDTFTEEEVKKWFADAGLKFTNKLPAPMGNNLMIAVKD